MIDLSKTKIGDYISKFDPARRENVVNTLLNGEKFINLFEGDEGRIFLDLISDKVSKELRGLFSLIREGKYEDLEELRRVRQHCIAIDTLRTMLIEWAAELRTFGKHANNL